MNRLYLTQTATLPMFHQLDDEFAKTGPGQRGFYLADRRPLKQYRRKEELTRPGGASLVKEWELVRRGCQRTPDREKIAAYERRLGDPFLWAALMSDRRLSQGRLAFLRQDYSRRYTHEEMLGILEESLDAFQRLFDEVKPDAVFSFICVTLGDYLGYLFARERNIPFFNLRSTRIENYVTWAPDVFEPSRTIRDRYRDREPLPPAVLEQAATFVAKARGQHLKYEGVLPVSDRTPKIRVFRRSLLNSGADYFRNAWDRLRDGNPDPSYYIDPVRVAFTQQVNNRWRAFRMNRALRHAWADPGDPQLPPYAFFPLHTEPEVSLLVQGRGFLNQIEVIRTLAYSLPVGWALLVKEHPASVGKRPVSYYRKLLAIPNVRLVRTGVKSNELIARASLVATISGTIGFEAVLQGKPVVTLGNTPFEFLPAGMVCRLTAPHAYAVEIAGLLSRHTFDHEAVVRYVAATLSCSTRANLYSGLLAREGGFVATEQSSTTSVAALAGLALERLGRTAPAVSEA